jgi:hypothetical protein
MRESLGRDLEEICQDSRSKVRDFKPRLPGHEVGKISILLSIINNPMLSKMRQKLKYCP